MSRKKILFYLLLPSLLSGCADAIFVSNVPDYLQNNDQAHVVVLTGDENARAKTAYDGFADQAPTSGPTQLDAPTSIGESPAQATTAALASKSVAPAPAPSSASRALENATRGAAAGNVNTSGDSAKNIGPSQTRASAAPTAIPVAGIPASRPGMPAAPVASDPLQIPFPAERGGPPQGRGMGEANSVGATRSAVMQSAPSSVSASGSRVSSNAAHGAQPAPLVVFAAAGSSKGKCQAGESYTKMKNGDFACCPKGGDVCYSLTPRPSAAAPAPVAAVSAQKKEGPAAKPAQSGPCIANESLTKMKSGDFACCPKGGDVCYRLAERCNKNEVLTEMKNGNLACCPAGGKECYPTIK